MAQFPYITAILCLSAASAAAQSSGTSSIDDELRENQAVLEDDLLPSARAHAMGGAIAPFADNTDAAFYNPAAIGHKAKGSSKKSQIKHFHFPLVGVSINENAQKLHRDFTEAGGATDVHMGEAVIDAHAGKRQFARTTFAPNAAVSRLLILPIYDAQIAAVPIGDETDLVDLHYRERSGIGLGISLGSEQLRLGVHATYMNIKDVRGEFLYSEMIDSEKRKEAFDEMTNRYAGVDAHVGLFWIIPKKIRPSFAVVANHVGDSQFERSTGDGAEVVKQDQDITVGFGINPEMSRWANLKFNLEGTKLITEDTALKKKIRTGLELGLWGEANEALLALRAGYQAAGAAFGGQLNVGLISLQYANFAEDIGFKNTELIERRQTITVMIDLAD